MSLRFLPILLLLQAGISFADDYNIGVAAVDITPDYPVRLSGFGFRREPSDGVLHRIWAKALVIADEERGPAVLITTDNLGVPAEITSKVAERLAPQIGLRRERLTITATHTHTAPMLRGVAPTLFGMDIPAEHQEAIDRYTREFTDKLVEVTLAAVTNAKPGRLEWGIGNLAFAKNRRTPGGPVDHDLPLLVVRGLDGKIRAVWFSYACHCVTMANNKVGGDWAGFAMTELERDHPGAVALASIGCGADANPSERAEGDKSVPAEQQGRQLADEIRRMLTTPLKAVTAKPDTQLKSIDLPFDTPRTRAEWEERAKRTDAIGHHARLNIARLDRGETLQAHIIYPIQTWRFDDQLAFAFLPGEVVVDYALRLKTELDRSRLCVVAYTNDAPCYIPSERVLKEGGYEGEGAMVYYDRPNRLAPGLEDRIVQVVKSQLSSAFDAKRGTEGTKPRSAAEALECFRIKPGLEVQLVASEPLVKSPVAIDWDAKGRLWVCEMYDYPTGIDEKWKPGGQVRILTDNNGDGRYDRATLFLDNLPFPTGVMAWKNGALICAAPDILYAEDTNNDGHADKVTKLFGGFLTDNYQARVNGLSLGLDGWIYGANGLLGGTIQGGSIKEGVNLRGRDFRMRPDTGDFEPASGLTQQGRVRDDWGNWFGCDNSRALFHFPLPDHYTRRNPKLAPPAATVNVPAYPESNRVFPISKSIERYNKPESAGRVTAGCGLAIYRDNWMGEHYRGNAFTCEPVGNLVHREVLSTDGVTFTSQRAKDEGDSEFLASTDLWFRPVQARTGPDGALYIVDMARFLIEHPRWIAPERMATIDARAGAELGRIWRVVKKEDATRPIRDLTKLNSRDLAAAMDDPNGTERDRVHLELMSHLAGGTAPTLAVLAQTSRNPEARAQALCVLDSLNVLTPPVLTSVLKDADPRVRKEAVRLSERFLASNETGAEDLRNAVAPMVRDEDRGVRFQLTLSLGEWRDPRGAKTLGALAASADEALPYFKAALQSSAASFPELTRSFSEPLAAPVLLVPATPGELNRLRSAPVDRAAVLADYQVSLNLRGEAERGKGVFARACALCHSVDNIGFAVGPDLAPLRDKPRDYWLQNILAPDAVVEPKFIYHSVSL
ncbi:MAG TPA: neutral/alkaline non-lysosomal ceramidase N-terminal domain-containing protein, partial [Chthoniobacteraceae bacterium]|nr:neutral/alkaline non-lysosomal ceramidase N-terminal domain-containing protein [Chthoniobacteraceae bacterium]